MKTKNFSTRSITLASTEREADISSRLSFLPKSNPTSPLQEGSNNNDNEPESVDYKYGHGSCVSITFLFRLKQITQPKMKISNF